MRRPSLPRRWSTWVGLLLVAAGLGVLGYVGWQMFVTNWIAQRQHADVVDRLRYDWSNGEDSARVEAGTATSVLRVPRFGADYEVPVLEGTSDDVLASGVGHFPESAEPGARGNFALAGHRVTHGEPLRDMPELQPGDEVVVETREAVFTYVLDTGGDDLTVDFSDTWVTSARPENPDPDGPAPAAGEDRLLTLTTCSELFHTDGRLVAFGHLASVERRG